MKNNNLSIKLTEELRELIDSSEESEKFLFYSIVESTEELFIRLTEILPTNIFKTDVLRDIYKGYLNFYKKYEKKPEKHEVSSFLLNSNTLETSTENIHNFLIEMENWFFSDSSREFQKDFLVLFLSRYKISTMVEDIVLDYQQKGKIRYDNVLKNVEELGGYNSLFSSINDTCLSDVSGFLEAKKEEFGSSGSIQTVNFVVNEVNNIMQYKGLSAGSLNVVSAPPGRGKTQLLIQQGVSAAIEGKTVLHVFLGDLQKYSALLRYLACFSNKSMNEISFYDESQIKSLFSKHAITGAFDNVNVLCFPPEEETAESIIRNITRLQEKKGPSFHYDLIMIDYDENFKQSGDSSGNMYTDGGSTYNILKKFATNNKSVVFIASQPKPAFYQAEILTLDSLAESSKKQKIADTIFTIGRPSPKANVGTLFVAKNRLGAPNRLYYIDMIGETQRVEAITESEYDLRRNGD